MNLCRATHSWHNAYLFKQAPAPRPLAAISNKMPLIQAHEQKLITSDDIVWLENQHNLPEAVQHLLAGLLIQNAKQQAQIDDLRVMLMGS